MKRLGLIFLLLVTFSLAAYAQGNNTVLSPDQVCADKAQYDGAYLTLEGKVVAGSLSKEYYWQEMPGFESSRHKFYYFVFAIRGQAHQLKVFYSVPLALSEGEPVRIYGRFLQNSDDPRIKLTNFIQAYMITKI